MLLVRIVRTACPLHMLKSGIEHSVRATDMDSCAAYDTRRKQWLPEIVTRHAKDVLGVNRNVEAGNMTS